MRYCKYLLILITIVSVAFTACHKDAKVTVSSAQVTVADTGKTLTFTTGQTFTVTLGNPGDGDYSFNTWQYDASVLKLDSHTYTPPANPQDLGNYGTDSWQFTTIKNGTTALKITASQNAANTVTMFSGTINVN